MRQVKKLVKSLLPRRVRQPILNVYHLLIAMAANVRHGFPARNAKIIMITGTNGKTSTATLVAGMLESAGHTVGINTTAYYRIAGKTVQKKSSRTIEDMFVLHKMFRQMKKAGCEYIILEATSQALDQHRLWGVPCQVAVMTNLTQDHLDYHGTMDRYAAAKFKLFKRRPPFIILNRDDEWFDYFNKSQAAARKLSYGTSKQASAQITNVSTRKDGSDFTLKIDGETIRIQTKLVGTFNLYNAAAAALVGYVEGLRPEQITAGIAKVDGVPGRVERVEAGQPFDVIVDYAHTPDALEKVLSAVRHLTSGKLVLVFGATGDRDRTKRPIMGRIASQYADRIFVTDEETYTEAGATIRAAILKGVQEAGGQAKTTEIADRGEAMQTAFKEAKKGDAVLITGLGHETTRNMGGKAIPWNDTAEAEKVLRKK
jgi:UDP-N-acetylmuramoyl-L-alanyl-D-glutamate--2,6-diaminopimelate ligase